MESKKKLFFWDVTRYLLLFFAFYPLFGGAEFSSQNPASWAIEVGASELLTNDGHIWGDFVWLLSGKDLRGTIWIFSELAVVIFSYLWAYRNWAAAKKIRIANWAVALSAYAGYTLFFPDSPRYDYFIFAYGLARSGWPVGLVLASILSLTVMWLGIILISGYLIYKSLREENSVWTKNILFLLSMGIPGFGHVAAGKIARGIAFMAAGFAVWTFSFYLSFAYRIAFIPALLFWLYAAADARKNN